MTDQNRVPWPPGWVAEEVFTDITTRAVEVAAKLPEPYSRLLELLADCKLVDLDSADFRRGPTYRQLAYIGHRAGLDAGQRAYWYELAEAAGLTQRHAGHIIARLDEAERGVSELEAMLSGPFPRS